MIGCLWTRVRKQSIIALYFEFENELKFYKLEARLCHNHRQQTNEGHRYAALAHLQIDLRTHCVSGIA